jgi:uncharacterized protein
MKLELETVTGAYQIQRYDTDSITINDQVCTSSLILMPQHLSAWAVKDFASLTEAHFAALIPLKPEVVLLGTGTKIRFPAPELLVPLINQGIGVEVMNTPAACRTYNVLMSEERAVVAALLFD